MLQADRIPFADAGPRQYHRRGSAHRSPRRTVGRLQRRHWLSVSGRRRRMRSVAKGSAMALAVQIVGADGSETLATVLALPG
jgi:hypothetical protein